MPAPAPARLLSLPFGVPGELGPAAGQREAHPRSRPGGRRILVSLVGFVLSLLHSPGSGAGSRREGSVWGRPPAGAEAGAQGSMWPQDRSEGLPLPSAQPWVAEGRHRSRCTCPVSPAWRRRGQDSPINPALVILFGFPPLCPHLPLAESRLCFGPFFCSGSLLSWPGACGTVPIASP